MNTSAAWAKRVEVYAPPPKKKTNNIFNSSHNVHFSAFLHVFGGRQPMFSALYAIARPSVCSSVCHTGGSVKKVAVRMTKFSPSI